MQVFIGPIIKEGRLKSIRTIHHLICLLMESSKFLFCFCSPNGMLVTCICLRCDKHKQDHYSTKSPSYPHAQVTTELTLYTLADVLIHGEHFKPNCNIVD